MRPVTTPSTRRRSWARQHAIAGSEDHRPARRYCTAGSTSPKVSRRNRRVFLYIGCRLSGGTALPSSSKDPWGGCTEWRQQRIERASEAAAAALTPEAEAPDTALNRDHGGVARCGGREAPDTHG
jgi:hypothetical protein